MQLQYMSYEFVIFISLIPWVTEVLTNENCVQRLTLWYNICPSNKEDTCTQELVEWVEEKNKLKANKLVKIKENENMHIRW